MSDDLDKLWETAKPVSAPKEDLDALWHQAKPTASSGVASPVYGAANGATLGFGDEIIGGISTPIQAAVNLLPKSLARRWDFAQAPAADAYRMARDDYRGQDRAAQKASPGGYAAGELGGTVLSSFLPGLGVAKGAGALQVLGRTALAGAGAGLGNSQADLTQGDVGRAALDTGVGAGAGLAAGGVGLGLGKLGRYAAAKVVGIDETVARKAAAEAAETTAKARSAAGTAAQDAYRQAEHLRELGGKGLLPEEGKAALAQLEAELAQKSADKLLPAVARKASTSQAFTEALGSEGQRASAAAGENLSAGELKRQVGARLMRYGLPAAMGAVAGGLGFGGYGAMGGAALGGALGNNFRPMMQSLVRMGSQPVVQRPLYQALSKLSGGAAAPAVERLGSAAANAIGPSVEAELMSNPGFASYINGGPRRDEEQLARVSALRRKKSNTVDLGDE